MFSSNTSQVAAVATQAEAIDFDGTNDYLIRSTDLTGNTDSSTFTFSVWVWSDVSGLSYIYTTDNTTDARVQTWISTTQVGLYMKNSAGTVILNASATVPNNNPPKNTWIHILWSINLASTSNRSCYINDVLQSAVSWDTYTNGSIDFTQPNHNIAGGPALGGYTKARLSNVYLDKTYRDMSVTANRRLFVTADLKPAAGQAALNPILYLPMSDPTQPGLNQGTGGDFTLTGTVARSGRGPNQYNAPYSDLDGTADYLSRTTAPTGIADGKVVTIAFSFNTDVLSNDQTVLTCSSSNSYRFRVQIAGSGKPSALCTIVGRDSTPTTVLSCDIPYPSTKTATRNYVVVVSLDLSNSSNRHFYVNGESVSPTFYAYTDANINFSITTTPRYRVGASADSTPIDWFNGRLGALWFNTSYIDLSIPANLAKFVSGTGINAAPVDLGATGELPTGTSPLIYLPMYGNNAGKNYGTGGDFTVNSGPYTGARGPNEFWGNWVYEGETGTITRASALSGVSDAGTGSFVFSFWPNQVTTNKYILTVGGTQLQIRFNSSNGLRITATNSGGTTVLSADNSLTITTGSRYTVFFSFDLSNTSKRYFSVNGNTTTTWNQYTPGATIPYSTRTNWRFFTDGSTGNYDGRLGEFFFTTEYIDFPLEANRLKFYDAFNNPCDLPSAITAATIPTPAIYLRFDPASLGSNSGTGGSFSPSGTFYDLGQF